MRLAEAHLLVLGDAGDQLAPFAKLGVVLAHQLDDLQRDLVQERPLDAEPVAVADRRGASRGGARTRAASRSGSTPSAIRNAVVRA